MYENLFRPILEKKLMFLFNGAVEKMTNDELRKISPAAAWSVELCTAKEKEKASLAVAEKIRSTDGKILFEICPWLRVPDRIVRENHREMVRETLERIERHREDISHFLPGAGDVSEILSVSGDGADVHNHGRLALVIETRDGKFIYKPHSCATDTVFHRMAENLFGDVFLVPSALDYGEYGFCEFIRNQPADNAEDIRSFYENFGGLAAVIHAFGGTDFHYENFLAQGKYPVPVDLEAFLTPQAHVSTDGVAVAGFVSDFSLSLNASGILPFSRDGVQCSPLLNDTESNRCMPVLNGKRQSVREYVSDFLAGFERIYDRCAGAQEELARYVAELENAPVRHLVRDTNSYAKFMRHLNSPGACRDADSQRRVYDKLEKQMDSEGTAGLKGLFSAERESLEERDIPLFYSPGGSHDLYSDGQPVVREYFARSAAETALERICRLCPEEKEFEKKLILRSFGCTLRPRSAPAVSVADVPAEPLREERAVEIAGELLGRIHAASIVSPCGQRGFLGYRGETGQCSVLPFSLSSGVGGISVFASAMAGTESKYRPIAEEILSAARNLTDTVLTELSAAGTFPESMCDAGLAEGLGGILTVFSLVPELCGEREVRRLREITEKYPIEKITKTDIYTGLSGLILGLNRMRGKFDVVPSVRRAADRILDLKTNEYNGRVLWKNIRVPWHLSGYGHGIGGIGAALIRAFRLTGDDRYRTAAAEAYRFEHEIWSERIGTWPDLRMSPVPDTVMHGICSGSPGMLLCLKIAEDSGLPCPAEDREKALRAVREFPPLFRDHLCCGNASAAEALIVSGSCDEAASVLGRIAARAELSGGEYTFLSREYEPFPMPDLFYGAAGVGYTMLRFARPESVPSIFL